MEQRHSAITDEELGGLEASLTLVRVRVTVTVRVRLRSVFTSPLYSPFRRCWQGIQLRLQGPAATVTGLTSPPMLARHNTVPCTGGQQPSQPVNCGAACNRSNRVTATVVIRSLQP